MTNKQTNIINTAFKLFATNGYLNTSTNEIAKKSKVSEGLIFRHFGSKEGLLKAIFEEYQLISSSYFEPIQNEHNPKKAISLFIDLIQKIDSSSEIYTFWKMHQKVKWELEFQTEAVLISVEEKITECFSIQGYKRPKEEAKLFITIINGVIEEYFLDTNFDFKTNLNFLKTKYGLD